MNLDFDALIGLLGPTILALFSLANFPVIIWLFCFGVAELVVAGVEWDKKCKLGEFDITHYLVIRGIADLLEALCRLFLYYQAAKVAHSSSDTVQTVARRYNQALLSAGPQDDRRIIKLVRFVKLFDANVYRSLVVLHQ